MIRREKLIINTFLLLLIVVFGSLFVYALFDDVESSSSSSLSPLSSSSSSSLPTRSSGNVDSSNSGSYEVIVGGDVQQAYQVQFYNESEKLRLASKYVFVRGFAKSGTSWTKMLVDLHNKIHLLPYGKKITNNRIFVPVCFFFKKKTSLTNFKFCFFEIS